MRLLALILLFTFSLPTRATTKAEEILICSTLYYPYAKSWVDLQPNQFDKFKHCAVSCFLALRCPASDVMQLGVLKEVIDFFGPGNAEYEDLKADAYGISLVTSKKVKEDKKCAIECDKRYSDSSCIVR
jgi:hypothetical protein